MSAITIKIMQEITNMLVDLAGNQILPQEAKITDPVVLAAVFGSKFFAVPSGVRLATFYSSIPMDARMVTFSSIRIRYDIVNQTLEVIQSSPT